MGATQERESFTVVEGPKLNKGTRVVVGAINAGALVSRFIIPRRDFAKKTGYQREASTERINRLVQDLSEKRVDLPTALLLNLRAFSKELHLSDGDDAVRLNLSSEDKLHVVDGQHRIEALKKLVERNPEKWSGWRISFVCMLGADEFEEMHQFYVVNSTAKSVRTDLALDLLKQQAEADAKIMDALEERGESWKVKAQTLTEALARTPLWEGRIRFPGQPRAETTIQSSGMVSSLKSLLGSPYFSALTTENQIKIVEAYWKGIRKIIPDPFDAPTSYVLQKSTGVIALHWFLISVLEQVRTMGKSVLETESYAAIMKDPLCELQGDTREGTVARGPDFWKAGAEGSAGSFSSNAGRRVLVAKLKTFLPPLQAE